MPNKESPKSSVKGHSEKLIDSFEIEACSKLKFVDSELDLRASTDKELLPNSKIETQAPKENFTLAAMFMTAAVVFFTAGHVSTKYLMTRSPLITPFDCTLALCVILVPVNLCILKSQGVSIIFSKDPKLWSAMGVRMFISICNNLALLFALKFIPISKSIVIYCMNPL